MLNVLKLVVIILLGIAFCSAQIKHVTRNLEQKTKDLDQIYVHNEKDLIEALSIKELHSIFIEAEEISLSDFIEINNENLVIDGYPSAKTRPILRCINKNSGILIRSKNVTLENLEILDCQSTAIIIESNDLDMHYHILDEEEDVSDTSDYNYHHHHHHDHALSTLVLKGLKFKNNVNLNNFGIGGAIVINKGFEVHITGCHFESNFAGDGGGIYSEGHSHIHIEDTMFVNNTAEFAGGAIYASTYETDHFHEIVINNCDFNFNSVLTGREDINGDALSNGTPVENAKFLEFSFPAPSGGAIYVSSFGSVRITDSVFNDNSAVSAGGAISLLNNLSVKIEKSEFKNNYLKQPEEMVPSMGSNLEYGGAIYSEFKGTAYSAGVVSDFTILLSTFTNNTSSYGGALHLISDLTSRLHLEHCNFNGNLAKIAGGGILARNSLYFDLLSLLFSKNRAGSGGGVMLTNGASAQFLQNFNRDHDISVTIFEENEAMDGGGLFILGSGTVNLQSTIFRENKAERYGGGVCAIDSLPSGRIGLQETEFYKNSASRGGAAFLDSIAKVDLIVTRSTLYNNFKDNVALAGGALYVHIDSQIYNSIFFNNAYYSHNRAVADKKEVFGDYQFNIPSDLFTQDSNNSRKLLYRIKKHKSDKDVHELIDTRGKDPCYPGGGGAICWILTDITDRAPATIQLSNSIFEDNEARLGGGLMVAIDDQFIWQSDCPTVTEVLSSLSVETCKSILMENNTYNGNTAYYAGGALFATNPELIPYRNKKNQMIYLSEIDTSDNEFFINNKFKNKMGYGKNIASNAKTLKLVEPLPIKTTDTYTPDNNDYGLVYIDHMSGTELGSLKIKVYDAYDNVITSGIKDSILTVSINSSILSGQSVANAIHGTFVFEQIIATALPNNYDIIMESNYKDIQPLRYSISIRDCRVGERNLTKNKVCTPCEVDFFGFDPLLPCEACPNNAYCAGGPVIVPDDNYWHSNPFSPQIHKCIEKDACSYKGRKDSLISYYDKIKNNYTINLNQFNSDEYIQCKKGYTGILCGSCAEGYAHSAGEKCVKCYETRKTAIIILFILIWTFVTFAITIKSTLIAIKAIRDMAYDNKAPMEKMKTSSSVKLADNACIEVFEDSLYIHSGISCKDIKKQGNLKVEKLYAAVKMSEIIKIIVNFLQITSVVIQINVHWPFIPSALFSAEGALANFGYKTHFAPFECLLEGDSAIKTLKGLQIHIAIPFLLIIFVSTIFFIVWLKKGNNNDISYIKSRITICLLVGIFFTYDSITEILFRILNCITVDENLTEGDSVYDNYSTAKDWYWAPDTGIKCFKGNHAHMAYVVSIPGLIVFTFGIPLVLSSFLIKSRYERKIYDKGFLTTYGFVYQSYRDDYVFWETAIMLRKIFIGAIIVYGYRLGPNLQAAISMGILIFALIAHVTIKPFKYDLLNNLEFASLLGSISVFYSVIFFNDTSASHLFKIALQIIIVTINLTLLSIFLYYFVKSVNELLYTQLKVLGLKEREIPKSIHGKIGSISKVHAISIKEKMDDMNKRFKCLVIGNNCEKSNKQSKNSHSITGLHLSSETSTEIPDALSIEDNNL